MVRINDNTTGNENKFFKSDWREDRSSCWFAPGQKLINWFGSDCTIYVAKHTSLLSFGQNPGGQTSRTYSTLVCFSVSLSCPPTPETSAVSRCLPRKKLRGLAHSGASVWAEFWHQHCRGLASGGQVAIAGVRGDRHRLHPGLQDRGASSFPWKVLGGTRWALGLLCPLQVVQGFGRPQDKTLCSRHIADVHSVPAEPFLGLVKASSLRHTLAARGRG